MKPAGTHRWWVRSCNGGGGVGHSLLWPLLPVPVPPTRLSDYWPGLLGHPVPSPSAQQAPSAMAFVLSTQEWRGCS